MITGTYERYWKTRTSFIKGAYAYRNTLHGSIPLLIIRKELGIDLEKKIEIIEEKKDYCSFVPYFLWCLSELILSDEK
jgi:hypothetical protein